MAVVALLAVSIAAMRGAGLEAVLSILVPIGVAFGFLKDRSLGGLGIFGAIVGGVVAVAMTGAISFLSLLRRGALWLDPEVVLLGPILGGIALLLVIGTVVLASRLPPDSSRARFPSSFASDSTPRVRAANPLGMIDDDSAQAGPAPDRDGLPGTPSPPSVGRADPGEETPS